jgi:hypothetical protein
MVDEIDKIDQTSEMNKTDRIRQEKIRLRIRKREGMTSKHRSIDR